MQEENLTEQKARLRSRAVCVVIPTYNNAGTILDVVRRSLEQCDDVIVVCDGCTDSTVELLSSLSGNIDILEFKTNRGKGAALREGFRHARQRGFAYAITLDADGQHFPEDIPAMLQANIDNPGALIVGERTNLDKAKRSRGSRFANRFGNFWFALQTGHRLSDTQTGYRLYPLKKLPPLGLLTSRYEAELELLVFASWAGVRLVRENVNVYYPPREERVSHFRPTRDFARISLLNTILCLLALVYGYPRSILRWTARLLRTLYSAVFFLLSSILVISPLSHLCVATTGDEDLKKRRLHRMINSCFRFIVHKHGIPGCPYSVSNPAGEDYSTPALILCNHQSHLDLAPLLAQTPKMIVMTAGYIWNNPVYRFTIRNADFLPTTEGIDKMLPKLRELVSKGYSIAVYPEGTRSLDCQIGRFHKGAFLIAETLGLDIIPLILYGSGRALPKHGRLLRKWPLRMEIDARITPEELFKMGETTRERASAMRKYYKRRYAEIADRIEQDL